MGVSVGRLKGEVIASGSATAGGSAAGTSLSGSPRNRL